MIQKIESSKIKVGNIKMKRKKRKVRSKCRINYYYCQFYEKSNPEESRCIRESKNRFCKIEKRRMEDFLNKFIIFSKLIPDDENNYRYEKI